MNGRTVAWPWSAALLAALACAGCGQASGGSTPQEGDSGASLSREQLLDPHVCGSCHADHYNDWLASMHAFAADDPVFLAMNARGQRETDGGLGTFCVNCHAPMAVRDGLTKDGLNLATLPQKYKGVTCYFCHSIDSVTGTHNAAVTVSNDLVMRGELRDPDPVRNSAHGARYAALQDITTSASASLCGACHDIVVPAHLDGTAAVNADAGAPIERTFAEWQASAFSSPMGLETCGASGCHMVRSSTPGVQQILSNALQGDLCVSPMGGIRVFIDPVNLGHDFPSGAAQDRRFWAQVVAYKGASVIYQSGVVPFGSPAFDAAKDPDLWLMRDCMFDPSGAQVDMFWQAASTEGNSLSALATFDMANPAFTQATKLQIFPRDQGPVPGGPPDRVTLDLWVEPIGRDVLDNLVDSGDLDPSVAAAMPTFPVSLMGSPVDTELVWTPAAAADSGVAPFVDPFGSLGGRTDTCVGTLPSPGTATTLAPGHAKCAP